MIANFSGLVAIIVPVNRAEASFTLFRQTGDREGYSENPTDMDTMGPIN